MGASTLLVIAAAFLAVTLGVPQGFFQQPVGARVGGAQVQLNPFYQSSADRRGRDLNAPQVSGSFNAQPSSNFISNVPSELNNVVASVEQPKPYNPRYPLTAPLLQLRIGVISDLDQASKEEKDGKPTGQYYALLNEGNLLVRQNLEDPKLSKVTVEWDAEKIHKIYSKLTWDGRGNELSTLNVFNGHLYSCDDKTGVIYELPLNETTTDIVPIPWAILADGNFEGPHGFKCEWATVKGGELWIGGHGSTSKRKERFVKRVAPDGAITIVDWNRNFGKLDEAVDIHNPGYLTHEAGGWSDILQKWIFMPRRLSKVKYDDATDGQSGSNIIFLADEDFNKVDVTKIGDLIPTHGFSSMKFIPGTGDQLVVALKTVETEGVPTESYIMVFDLNGNVLLPETKFADQKYEGVEFL